MSLLYQYSELLFWPIMILGFFFAFSEKIHAFLKFLYSFEKEFSFSFSWKFSLSRLASFLITIFEFFGEKIRLLTVKQTRYPQNRRRKKYSDVIREANLKLAQQDSIFRRRGTIIDLTTEVNDYSTKCAFKIWVEIPGLSPTMAEIDSDSDINLKIGRAHV